MLFQLASEARGYLRNEHGVAVLESVVLPLEYTNEIKFGDTTLIYTFHANKIHINSVRTPSAKRGQGSAKAALELFLKETDRLKIPVSLDASPLDKKTKLGKLVAFYQKYGFKLTGKSANLAGDPQMFREVPGGKVPEKF